MPKSPDGTLQRSDTGVRITFERDLDHPIEKVWSALTEPERVKDWLAESEIDLRVGGRVYLKGDEIESEITDLDPPKVLQYGWRSKDWDGGQIRFELSPTSSGTRLTFTHVFTPMSDAQGQEFRTKYDLPDGWDPIPSNLAGWHAILDKLENALGGAPSGAMADWHEEGIKPDDPWVALNEHYKKVLAR